MKIVADENIPLVDELFSDFGEIEQFPGRELSAAQVADADILLVRSVTGVDESLLKNSAVQFVGTATIGTDHIDQIFLQQRGIGFASAPGCNASSVVQYVFSAFSALKSSWQSLSVGIVGCGNVGGLLYRQLRALGVECRCYDPFLSTEQIVDLTTLEEVLACDIICLHTPLSKEGPHPTYHLMNATRLTQLKPGTLLLNAGRGEVIDNQALLKLLPENDWQVALDVWEPEPEISLELLKRVAIATPHIAGHSRDGKIKATAMLRDSLCAWLGRPKIPHQPFIAEQKAIHSASLNESILSSYDVREDDRRMRGALLADGVDVGAAFDQLRKNYPRRLEFHHYFNSELKEEPLKQQLRQLGFVVAE